MIKPRYYLIFVTGLLAAASLHAAWGSTDAQPEKPKVYALVAAVGEQFTIVTEQPMVGSHASPYYSESFKVKDNFLNLSILRSLDKAMAQKDPDSKRIYMTLNSPSMDAAEKWEREDVALNAVEANLKGAPERAQWDRIIVVTPAYHPYEANGLGGRLIGFGIFYQPKGRSVTFFQNFLSDFRDDKMYNSMSEEGVTPSDRPINVSQFVAPFAFLDVWVLDAKTFAVIDRQRTYDSVKIFNPQAASTGMTAIYDNVSAEDQTKYVFRTLETSVEKAVAHSQVLNGIVRVGEPKEVESGKKDD